MRIAKNISRGVQDAKYSLITQKADGSFEYAPFKDLYNVKSANFTWDSKDNTKIYGDNGEAVSIQGAAATGDVNLTFSNAQNFNIFVDLYGWTLTRSGQVVKTSKQCRPYVLLVWTETLTSGISCSNITPGRKVCVGFAQAKDFNYTVNGETNSVPENITTLDFSFGASLDPNWKGASLYSANINDKDILPTGGFDLIKYNNMDKVPTTPDLPTYSATNITSTSANITVKNGVAGQTASLIDVTGNTTHDNIPIALDQSGNGSITLPTLSAGHTYNLYVNNGLELSFVTP